MEVLLFSTVKKYYQILLQFRLHELRIYIYRDGGGGGGGRERERGKETQRERERERDRESLDNNAET
jgi:hypothetical protein